MITPSVYRNPNPLRAEDLNDHPLAGLYIEYLRNVRNPVEFKIWLERRENEQQSSYAREAAAVAAMAADPYCRSPAKIRVHRRTAPGRYK